LSWQWLFLIMRCKKRPHPVPGGSVERNGRGLKNGERCGGE
jgi:hypothetical protein